MRLTRVLLAGASSITMSRHFGRTTPSGFSVTADATLNRMPVFAAYRPRLLDELGHDPPLSLDRNAVGDVDQKLDQAVDAISPSPGCAQTARSGSWMRGGWRRSSQALSMAARLRSRLAASAWFPARRSSGNPTARILSSLSIR
jgi:hypothetical protein